MPQIYRSIDRLNAIYNIFTSQGNGKLDRGEVDALAAFYEGLSRSSKSKVRDRLIDIFQTSHFSRGQEQRFLNLLKAQNFSVGELLNIDPNDPTLFTTLPVAEQYDQLTDIYDAVFGWRGYESPQNNPFGARANVIVDNVKSQVESFLLERLNRELEDDGFAPVDSFDSYDVNDSIDFYADPSEGFISELRELDDEDNMTGELLGYVVYQPIYVGADVDEAYFFNRDGEYLGDLYQGE